MKQPKKEYERSVFHRFVKAAGLSINPRSIRSPQEPRNQTEPRCPDISCRFGGRPYYFELTRMVHPDIAKARGDHISQLGRTGSAPPLGAYLYNDRTALRMSLTRKASKKYETSGRPLALLLYLDGVFHPPNMPPSWARTILEDEGPNRHWVGIWLYDAVYNRIVASWP